MIRGVRTLLALLALLAMNATLVNAAQDHDHGAHSAQPPPAADEHGAHDAASEARPRDAHDHGGAALPAAPIPMLTDADRLAAQPPAGGHAMHEGRWYSRVQLDRLEAWKQHGRTALGWEADAWWGTDLNRLWLRSEGQRLGSETSKASVEALWGHAYARWWDVLAGVRHDFGREAGRDYLAIGVQGLAPYWFEISATGYLEAHGRHAARVEVEHDLLFTNRLMLQSLLKADAHARRDARHATGAGVSSVEFGLRLRFEVTRRFAPYVGLGIERAVADTADMRRSAGHDVNDTRVVVGVRTWF